MDDGVEAARGDARAALRAGVEAADPEVLVARALEGGEAGIRPGEDAEGVRLAALGKAAPAMARALAGAWPDAPGVVAAPEGVLEGRRGAIPEGWDVVPGGHPLPDEGGLRAGEALLEQARAVPEDGALLVGVTGGGSACAEAPRVPLEDLRSVTGRLLAAGVDVGELNAVRRPLSELKGGGLARACGGQVVGLALSDVVGDDLVDVASGPTVPAASDPGAARAVLEEAGVWSGAPASVREALSGEAPAADGGRGPDEGGTGGPAPVNRLVGGNGEAVAGAAEALRGRGWRVEVTGEPVAGEAREVGRELARRGREAAGDEGGVAVVAGGEATVTVEGEGRGGPCQELALAAAGEVAGEAIVVGAAATDGVDGPTDAAGGLVDGATVRRAEAGGVEAGEALGRNDAYRALETAGDLLRWGPTGTNVNDVVVVLVP